MPTVDRPVTVVEFRKNLGDAIGTVRYGPIGTTVYVINRKVPCAALISADTADLLNELLKLAKSDRHSEIGDLVKKLVPK
jgi:hypothetical protein